MNRSRSAAVLPADLGRIEAAFRDLSQNTGEPAYLSYASFKRDVFASFLPDRLASVGRTKHSLFDFVVIVFRFSLASLQSIHQFISIGHVVQRSHLLSRLDLSWLTERTHAPFVSQDDSSPTSRRSTCLPLVLVLYAIFAQGGTLYWQDVENLLAQCNDRLPQSRDLAINFNEMVTQEQFLAWLAHHQGHTTKITDWLLDDQRLYELLTYAYEKTYDQYSILAGVTHCT